MILWEGSIFSDVKMGSVWTCGLELVILRMAFFCIMNIFSMFVFDEELTMSGIGGVNGIVNDRWFSVVSEEESFLLD